jgi:hypothetical protein
LYDDLYESQWISIWITMGAAPSVGAAHEVLDHAGDTPYETAKAREQTEAAGERQK